LDVFVQMFLALVEDGFGSFLAHEIKGEMGGATTPIH
jgi:hypothetical protein